jgi:hypothetical protein
MSSLNLATTETCLPTASLLATASPDRASPSTDESVAALLAVLSSVVGGQRLSRPPVAAKRPRHRRMRLESMPNVRAMMSRYPQHDGRATMVEVRMARRISRVDEECQLGMFTTRPIALGEKIVFYADHTTHMSEYYMAGNELSTTHARRIANTDCCADGSPVADMYTRYVPRTEAELDACAAFGAERFLPSAAWLVHDRVAFDRAPKGSLANSGKSSRDNNCKWVKFGRDIDGGLMLILEATRAIADREEILTPYHNNEEANMFLRRAQHRRTR